MAETTAKDRALDAAYDLAAAPHDGAAGARDEVNQIWSAGNLSSQELKRGLEQNNLLAPLVFYDSQNLDPNHDGMISYQESLGAATAEGSDTLTKTLAGYIADQSAALGYADIAIDGMVRTSGTPIDPIPGEMDFDPATFADGKVGARDLAYADENFAALDGDNDGYVTSEEIDNYRADGGNSISEADAAKLQDLSSQVGELEEGSDDEWSDENSGFSRADLQVAAQQTADELNEERQAAAAEEEAGETADEDAAGDTDEAKDTDTREDDTPATSDSVLAGEENEDDPIDGALATLADEDSSTEDQLAAIKALVEGGQTETTIRDADGSEVKVRMEVVPISEGSDRSYVQMFAVDENGRETVVLRAISSDDGFAQQRDANGNPVSYVGSRWQARHPESVFGE